ncbi:MAG: hypothetical protein E6377_07470 [Clostridium sp.]|uniref:hypothetical protein n=1 Tax=Clostridium sp. TaxID=1506 RepID=UPI002907393C|nr:hypothetical protein [Clostridium sp.]MDU6935331.1 hypothetical protein [Clostridium sp.]
MNLKNKAESERLKEALLILNGKLIRDKDIELAIQDFNDKFDNNMNVPGWAIFFLLN